MTGVLLVAAGCYVARFLHSKQTCFPKVRRCFCRSNTTGALLNKSGGISIDFDGVTVNFAVTPDTPARSSEDLVALLSSVGLKELPPDGKSALQQAMDPVSLDASKHIDLRAHFLRERARDRVVLPEYVDTTSNWADGLTKSLPLSTFLQFAKAVCVTAALRSD